MSYVYIKSEIAGRDNCEHDLWTVGFYRPDGKFEPESDHTEEKCAAERTLVLNGGTPMNSRLIAAAELVLEEMVDLYDGVEDSKTSWMGHHITRLTNALRAAKVQS